MFCVYTDDLTSTAAALLWRAPCGLILGFFFFFTYYFLETWHFLSLLCGQPSNLFSTEAQWCMLSPASTWLPYWHQGMDGKLMENKTEIMLFKPGGTSGTVRVDFSSLSLHEKSVITNLGVKMDAALKLDVQVNAMVKSCLFFFSWGGCQKASLYNACVIHACVTSL